MKLQDFIVNRIIDMKLFSILLIIALPISGLAATDSGKHPNSKPYQDLLELSIRHRINDGDFLPKEILSLPIKKLKSEPLLLLQLIRKNLSNHLKTLPVKINTELDLINGIDKLPTIFIETKVDKDSNGVSDLSIPAQKFSDAETLVNWQGLSSHFTFTNDFVNIKADTKLAGIEVTEQDKLLMSLEKVTVHSMFDADLRPTKIQVSIPSFKAQDNGNSFNLQSFIAKIDIKKLASGFEIGNLVLQLKHFDFTEDNVKTGLDNLQLITDTKEQKDVINFNLQTKVGKLNLPKNIGSGIDNVVQIGNISLLNLDTVSLLNLQTKFRKSHNNPMAAIIMLGELMEIAPNILAKSPKIELNQLLIKTSKGNLVGDFTIGLDGTKANSLALPVLFNALYAKANLNVSKQLLEQAMINQFQQSSENAEDTKRAKIAAKEQIKSYLEQKILVEAGDNYQLIANLKDGKLVVNKQDMPLSLP